MKSSLLYLFTLLLLFSACTPGKKDLDYEFIAGDLKIVIGENAQFTQISDINTGKNYLHPDSLSYLIRVRFEDEIMPPLSAKYLPDEEMLYYYFPGDREIKVWVKENDSHLTFELHNIRSVDKPDLLVWGPFFNTINETIGETVGVVRNKEFAIGIQSLNPKTLGGYPWRENDEMPQMDYSEQENYSDLSNVPAGLSFTLYQIEAARPVKGGSALHAYCRNRYKERTVNNWGYTNYSVDIFKDKGLIGSSIALFGCKPEEVLDNISNIELSEGLPHPEFDGHWSKTAAAASAAYMILDFSEDDIDKALAYTEQAGLKYLYHSSPFQSWGHFPLKENFFPDGEQSLKRCVDKASEKEISIGLHILSNFITTKDAYVTPVPDPRLAKVGYSILEADISDHDTEIVVRDPAYFNQFKNNHLKAIQIGDEIICYAAVTEAEPWTLFDCQRGAFGTEAIKHTSQDTIFKLADHGYKVFLSNPELTLEIAENIATLYNETGVRQISFDGLEGCRSTGLGNYGEILFTKQWYDHLDDDIRSHFIADASRTSHYFWHIFTRMNWGEPWYAGFRESQTQYRLKNQKYFDRNYIPNMLGWFLMRPETSIEDIEWLLARSAAFDAGYAFVSSYEALENNGYTDEILSAIARWEDARMKGVFTAEQKKIMEDVENEFHLGKGDDGLLSLTRIYPYRLNHKNKQRQPGEPVYSTLDFDNPGPEQVIHFILTAKKGTVINPHMEFDGNRIISIPVKLEEGEHLKFNGQYAHVCSSNWQILKSISLDTSPLTLSSGAHHIEARCDFVGSEGEMNIELRLNGETEIIP